LSSAEVRVFRALATVDAVLLQFAPTLDLRTELRSFFGAYTAHRLLAQDVPGLLHRLPEVVDILSRRLDAEVSFRKAHVSRFRRGLGIALQAMGLGALLTAALILVLPRAAVPPLARLELGRWEAVLLTVLAAALLAWLGRLLHLRSVVVGVPARDTPDSCRRPR
jgi:hypothetical protein